MDTTQPQKIMQRWPGGSARTAAGDPFRYVFRSIKRAIRIGEFPGITVEEAPKLALGYGALLDQGRDP